MNFKVKNCLICNKEFKYFKKNKRYCSQKCMSKGWYNNNFKKKIILCMNCNWCMGLRGYCPHNMKVEV